MPLADDVDLDRLASGTVGLTGADIRNLVNEAALWATRNGKDKVDMDDFEHARDSVLMGPKREEVLSGKEKRMTAIHESGHALLAWIVPGADRVHKVTIIPRGRSLGVTQLLPEEDRLNINESELHGRLCFMLGGRAAEKMAFGQYQRRGRERPDAGHATCAADGDRLGNERAAGAGRLSHERRAPLSGEGNLRAARIQRAHAQLIDEEVAHPARSGRSSHRSVAAASRAIGKAGHGARARGGARRKRNRTIARPVDQSPRRRHQRPGSRCRPQPGWRHQAVRDFAGLNARRARWSSRTSSVNRSNIAGNLHTKRANAMSEPMLAHLVYFTLKDNSPVAKSRQLELCKRYLDDHPGIVFYGAGTRNPDLSREVNDKEFDIALTVVFKDRAAHDAYQTAPRHVKFIEESKPNWAKVRVFDSDLA